jgi:hypothetical protein
MQLTENVFPIQEILTCADIGVWLREQSAETITSLQFAIVWLDIRVKHRLCKEMTKHISQGQDQLEGLWPGGYSSYSPFTSR